MKHSRVARILALAFAALAFAFPLSGSLGASGSTSEQASSGAVLPNFASQGSNLIRLLAGAFDPLSDPLPVQAAIPAINEATLAESFPSTGSHSLAPARISRSPTPCAGSATTSLPGESPSQRRESRLS
jgi:hypothetical protein